MKKIKSRLFHITVALTVLCAVLAACGGSPAPVTAKATSAPDELDTAIRETSDYLNRQLPRGSKLAILNIQSGSPALSEYN